MKNKPAVWLLDRCNEFNKMYFYYNYLAAAMTELGGKMRRRPQ